MGRGPCTHHPGTPAAMTSGPQLAAMQQAVEAGQGTAALAPTWGPYHQGHMHVSALAPTLHADITGWCAVVACRRIIVGAAHPAPAVPCELCSWGGHLLSLYFWGQCCGSSAAYGVYECTCARHCPDRCRNACRGTSHAHMAPLHGWLEAVTVQPVFAAMFGHVLCCAVSTGSSSIWQWVSHHGCACELQPCCFCMKTELSTADGLRLYILGECVLYGWKIPVAGCVLHF